MNSLSNSPDCDVLIVGAGPVGMVLASELTRRGVSCRIIDKSTETFQESRALGIQARTLELFEKMGIVDAFTAEGVRTKAFNIFSRRKKLARIDFGRYIQSSYPYILMLPQNRTEAVLHPHLEKQGIVVERGVELIDFTQQGNGVQASLRHSEGQEEQIKVKWLIGSDGAHSTVRHKLGAQFEGSTYDQSFVLSDVHLDWDMPNDEGFAFVNQGDAVAFFPMPGGLHRVFVVYKPPKAPEGEVTLAEVQQAIDEYGPVGAKAHDPVWSARFRINQRKVEHYKYGRVFLLGDASHIHSPVAAQGMNTGIQDAWNLAWKLELVASGRASEDLLESFEAERGPVGKALLRGTDIVSRVVWLRQPIGVLLRDNLITQAFNTSFLQQRFAENVSEIGISYKHENADADRQARKARSVKGLHAGDRAVDGDFQVGTSDSSGRLFDLLHGTSHTLLDFTGHRPAHERLVWWQSIDRLLTGEYRGLVDAYHISLDENPQRGEDTSRFLHDLRGNLHQSYGIEDNGLVLIRPDGYIGFFNQPLDVEQLRRYLKATFIPLPGKVTVS